MASMPSELFGGTGTLLVDGAPLRSVLTPESPQEVADLLQQATAAGDAVTPVGGGTKLSIGNFPSRTGIAISTSRLSRVLHYEPTDMTLSTEAGIGFATLKAILAEQG